jgi:predicted amidophosphoribosyltransferase
MKKRGFNQAALLAEEISKRTGIPLLDIMERTVDTLPQKNLSVDKRRDNLEKVFRIREGVLVPSVIMIVDDIFTTGATVSAAARILKESGASEVYFTSICRA